jgi:uncharacterized membrane protein YdbT with pleckstrin-like domain
LAVPLLSSIGLGTVEKKSIFNQGGHMGQYVEGNLVPGEQVVYETKNHWMIFVSIRAVLTLFIGPLIEMASNEFAITNKRVLVKEGLIARRGIDMAVSKVESVSVNQSILGRILGYGTIVIRGTGGTNEPFHKIANPMEFRKQFQATAHA